MYCWRWCDYAALVHAAVLVCQCYNQAATWQSRQLRPKACGKSASVLLGTLLQFNMREQIV